MRLLWSLFLMSLMSSPPFPNAGSNFHQAKKLTTYKTVSSNFQLLVRGAVLTELGIHHEKKSVSASKGADLSSNCS